MSEIKTISGLFRDMMKRCYNEKSVIYRDYGAKGIIVCPDWHDYNVFHKWAIDNNWSSDKRLKRYDTKLGYNPDNCFLSDHNTKIVGGTCQKAKENKRINKVIKEKLGIKKFTDSPHYSRYNCMKERCENPKHHQYPDYGARGIRVCEEWLGHDGFLKFLLWAEESGYKEGLTIERIDVNKGYSPDNCRWATVQEQSYNKRNTIRVNYHGEMHCLSEVARIEGIKYSVLSRYIKNGIDLEDALEKIKINPKFY